MQTYNEAYYQENYRDYNSQRASNKHQFYLEFIQKYCDQNKAQSIHDMGCAFGHFLSSCPSTWQRFGSDLSDFSIKKAKSECPEIIFRQGNAFEQKVFEQKFTVTTAFDVLEHLYSLDPAVESIKSQMSSDGLFVFVVPVYDGPFGPIVHLLDGDPTHIHKCSRHFWLTWAGLHFDVLDWQGLFRYGLTKTTYLHFPTNIFRTIAPAIIVAARAQTSER